MKETCPTCEGGADMFYGSKDICVKYKNLEPRLVPTVIGWHCPNCGECLFALGESMRCIETLEAMKTECGDRVLK